MWVSDKARLVKVRLHNRGEDVETAWAEDLGALDGGQSGRLVRLDNVLFLHAKPTYGDVIAVKPDPNDQMLEWNAEGVPFEDIGTRIEHDEGRWVAIIDYWARPPHHDLDAAFKVLARAGEKIDVVVEGASRRKDGRTACAYLAVPAATSLQDLMGWLRSEASGVECTLIHPVDRD